MPSCVQVTLANGMHKSDFPVVTRNANKRSSIIRDGASFFRYLPTTQ